MKRKWTLPVIAIFGILFGILMVAKTTKPAPKSKMIVEPSKAPFESYVSGAGLIEASTENVKVGTTSGGLVTEVFVRVGDKVTKGQPLFQIDSAVKQAQVVQYEASLKSAEASLDKLRKGNRPEEIAMQEEQVHQADAQLQDAQEQFKLREAAYAEESRAISQDDLNQARNNVRLRQAALSYQQQHLQELKNGTWAPEIKIQEATVASAKAQVQQARAEIERMTVRSPLGGQVLQVKIHAGEYAPAAQTDDALVMVGSDDTLSIRVDVDEQDAWRVKTGKSAVAYPRGRSDIKIPLTFARVEPYVIPKKSLTGSSSERVDTRVLQVVYNFQQPTNLHVYMGQQMDVFIEADPLPDPGVSSSTVKGGQ